VRKKKGPYRPLGSAGRAVRTSRRKKIESIRGEMVLGKPELLKAAFWNEQKLGEILKGLRRKEGLLNVLSKQDQKK